jgi:hypothetical protein
MSEERLSLTSQVVKLEEQYNNYKKKCQELENIIQTKNELIIKLKLNLEKERFKSHLYEQLILTNTEIKLGEIYEESDDKINIQNFPNGNVHIIVQNYLEEPKQYNINVKKKPDKQPGKNFRSVKNQVEIIEEKPEQQEEKIKQVDDELEEMVQENKLDVSYKETTDFIETMFDETVKNRIYKKYLASIKEYRNKLLGKLDLEEYVKLIKTHITRLENIFINKKYDQKKITSIVLLSLSALEQRLVCYGQYYNSHLEADDIQKLKLCLKINMNYPKRYIPLSSMDTVKSLSNYAVCVTTIRENLKRVLVNPYGFPNLVYLNLEKKSTVDDPYSYYSLEKVDSDGKRCWKMECRLDEFSKFIAEHVKTYCISLFRKIYYDIFNDNIYREDYLEKSPALQQDCEQLLVNIIVLTRHKTLCNILRDLVKKYSTIQPSVIDKFNFTRDDQIVKRNFSQEEDVKELTSTIKRVFDDISTENAEKIWQCRME